MTPLNSEITVKVAGQAGQGLQTITWILMKALARRGSHLFAVQDFMSRVRGGHNFNQIRAGFMPLYSMVEKSHIIVALDRQSVEEHESELDAPGLLIYDPDMVHIEARNRDFLPVPMNKIAGENGNILYANSVAVGCVSALMDLALEEVEAIFLEQLAGKGEEALGGNMRSLRAGWDFIVERNLGKIFSLGDVGHGKAQHLLLSGSDAIGLGAIQGGCRFISAYPMSPSTSVFSFISQRARRRGILSEQAEDEIASINMALGASAAGARAMTTTSGGGMALMAEGISLAGVAEIPVVILDAQRPGPATGLPTRTGQEDLGFTLHIGHGEFPRFVFAPGTAEEAFYTTMHAFNLAEKYQVPAFILADQHLVDSYQTLKELKPDVVRPESYIAGIKDFQDGYSRYKITQNGVSPMAYFNQGDFTFMVDSHEHTESGHITEEIETRNRMVEKRLRKAAGMAGEFGEPEFYGASGAETVFLCWGSTYGAVREAVDALNNENNKAGMVHFNRLAPFPSQKAEELIRGARRIVNVEANATGQFRRLLRSETGICPHEDILRYDGRPMTGEYILSKLKFYVN